MITIAVASYNHAAFVKQCLESIVDQSYPDLELCWIDDHSTDDTFEVVRALLEGDKLRERFSKIVLRRNSYNRGAAFSLNLAARAGSAKLISFVNSDDYYQSQRLAACTADFHDADQFFFAFSNTLPVDKNGHPLVKDPTGQAVAFDADLLIHRYGSISRALLKKQIASSTGNFVVSRALFNEIGGFQDLRYCHDWMFALQACLHCEPKFLRERLYYYRLHPTNSFRSLGIVAEHETDLVLSAFFEALALRPPENVQCPCPRRNPSRFWDIVRATDTAEIAERVFFPYLKDSRMLSARQI